MTTTFKQLTTSWGAITSTSGSVDVSVNHKGWECVIDTSLPANGYVGRLLKPNRVYNIILESTDVLYAKTVAGKDILVIDS